MRKLLIPVVMLIALSQGSPAQESFKVIKVNGTIILKSKGTSLETGTVFSDKEPLVFRSDDATAAVINSRKGRVILTSSNHDLTAASSNFLPSMYNISTRGGLLISAADLKNHFSGRYVVLGRSCILPDRSSFPMDKDHFFFIRYAFRGENINKKLDFSGDSIIIDREKLYTVDGKPIPDPDNTMVTLFYRRGEESVMINSFNLIFPDLLLLGKEAAVILDALKEKPEADRINEIKAFIDDSYGTVQKKNVETWLRKSFGMKSGK